MYKRLLSLVMALVLVFGLAGVAQATEYLNVATGGTSGTYYPLGGDIATLLTNKVAGVEATAQATGASQENLRLLNAGDAELAIVQNDVMDYAYKGTESFEGEVITSFTAIGALYPELLQIVVAADSDIQTIADLKGRAVSIGAAGSGTAINAIQILGNAGLTLDDVDEQYLSFKESADAFQNLQIEAFFVTAGLPNAAIQEVATARQVRLLGLDDESMAKLTETYSFYVPYTVPAGTYSGMEADVVVPSISAVLAVKADLDEELVYQITKALYEDTAELSHAKKSEITKENAVKGIPVPFHAGAERYFKEQGLID